MWNKILSRVALVLVGGLLVCGPVPRLVSAPAQATPEDVFKAKGLTKVGFLLITAQEAEIHATVTSVRSFKAKVATESAARASSGRSVQIAEDAIGKLEAALTGMEAEMKSVKGNPDGYNKLVDPYNDTLKQAKLREAALEELKKKRAKIGDSQSACNEMIIASARKADAAMAVYAALAQDAALATAIAQYSKGAPQPIKLGPSGNCINDVTYLRKCISDMAADGIPVRMSGGVPVLEVIVNGKKHEMLWDSGAAGVFLSAESAADLGLHATDTDKTIQTVAADGRTIDCKLIVIPEIRVGPFTAQNVEALIAPPSDTRGSDLLGGSFQNRFLCRLDQEAGVLHLTPNPAGAPAPIKSAAPAAVAHDDIFKTKGLTKVGDMMVASQEADIHAAILSLRGLKTKVTTETSARANMSRAVQNAADILGKLEADLERMDGEMKKVKGNDVEYNKIVDSYNATLKQARQRKATFDELRKKLGKMDDSQSVYTETAVGVAQKVEPVLVMYAGLSKDAALKAQMDKLNKGAAQPIALGPSATFSSDVEFLRQTLIDLAAEGVPINMDGGVPNVQVTINGKTVEMVWDSGASFVSFSAETAAALGLHATDKDETITTTVADGKHVQSKLIVVPSIRVGEFTAQNVKCLIDPPGGERSPDLLGGTFQSQFLCRLDQQAGVLHLTPNDKSTAQPAAATTPGKP